MEDQTGGRPSGWPRSTIAIAGGGTLCSVLPLAVTHADPRLASVAIACAVIATIASGRAALVWIRGRERRQAHMTWARQSRRNIRSIARLPGLTRAERMRLYEFALAPMSPADDELASAGGPSPPD